MVNRSFFTTQLKRLVPMLWYRWKISSSYIRCDLDDGIDLAQGACKPEWMFILRVIWDSSVLVAQLLALQEGRAVGWMNKESSINFGQGNFVLMFMTSTQPLRSAQPLIQSVVSVKWLGNEANHLSLSSARIKNMWSCMCCTSTPPVLTLLAA